MTSKLLLFLLITCTKWHISVSFKVIVYEQIMTKAFSEACKVLLGRYQTQDTVSRINFTNYTNSKVNIYSVLWCDL
jgi:hypothetical protein